MDLEDYNGGAEDCRRAPATANVNNNADSLRPQHMPALGRATETFSVPVVTFKSGSLKYKSKKMNDLPIDLQDPYDCLMVFEEGSSKLYFKVLHQKQFLNDIKNKSATMKNALDNKRVVGEKKYTTLEFDDVTAADLKVTSKFGSWDTMATRLLVENKTPLVTWQKEKLANMQNQEGLLNRHGPVRACAEEDGVSQQDNRIAYLRNEQESCMVKVTFDVSDLQKVRDILHKLKVAKLHERKSVLEDRKRGLVHPDTKRVPSKVREGLPEWVNYIPAKWYSMNVRQVLEYLLVLYTLLTLSWAVWQLYKHVGFIQRFLRPILQVVEFYLDVLRSWFHWLDGLFDVFTGWWWKYLKPVLMLATPLYTALATLFKPLRNIADVITMVTSPLMSCFRVALSVLHPLAQPFSAFLNAVRQMYGRVSVAFGFLWGVVSQSPIMRLVVDRLQGMGIQNVWNELCHSNLDPLKAQVALIQNILMRSFKQVFYGMKFVMQRISYMSVFIRRERDYAREETALDASSPPVNSAIDTVAENSVSSNSDKKKKE